MTDSDHSDGDRSATERNGPDQPQFQLTDEVGTVTVRKHRTKRGERVEIAAVTDRIRLDALILEGLSWQRSREDIAARIDDGEALRADLTPLTGGDPAPESTPITITNEYAQVELSHVRTETGDTLKIRTPARGSELNLGVKSCIALAKHDDTFAFSTLFETPVGPEDTPVEGPH